MSPTSDYLKNQYKEIDGDTEMHPVSKERSKKSASDYGSKHTACGICPVEGCGRKMVSTGTGMCQCKLHPENGTFPPVEVE